MKKMKRILAIMLCLTMAISGPLSVFAEETNTVVEEKCSECGSMDGHTEECSQYVPTEPEAECNCEAVDEKHAETCPKYTVPEENQTTNEESEPVVERCTECGSTEGHTEECSQYVSEESKAECNCEAIDEKHAETCPKYTIPEDNQTTSEELEPVVESCTECGSTEGHTEECSHYIPAEPEIVSEESESVPEIGDKIWIKKGSKVYKNTTDDEKKAHTLIGNYEVKIKQIIANEDGVTTWYEFEFTSLGLGELWIGISGYKYVQVENTSIIEPEVPDEPEDPEQSEETTKVELEDGTVVIADGIPEDAKLVVEAITGEKAETAEQLADTAICFDEDLVNGNELFYKTYNISVEQEGNEWQPEAGDTVEVVIDTGIDWLDYRSYVQVVHILDDVDAINAADTKYLHFGKNLKEQFPKACEAAENAGYPENYVVYTIMSPEEGEVSFNKDGEITLHSTSFSDHIIVAYNVDNGEHISETEDVGVKRSKTATYDNKKNLGTVTLSSYVKGTVKSTPTDVVLVIDHSGSMWTAVNPENGELKFSELEKEKGKREGYYVAFARRDSDDDAKTTAYRVLYENGKWISKGSFTAETYDSNRKFLGFINSVASETDKIEFNEENAKDYIFAISISGALYDALNVFMDEMKNAVDCRVAVVTFAGKIQGNQKNDNDTIWEKNADHKLLDSKKDYIGSGIFIDGELTWDSTEPILEKEEYKSAFVDPTTVIGQKTLNDTINAIKTNYGNTPTALGLLYARQLFLQAGREESQKVAIVFTDGIPSPGYIGCKKNESCSHSDKNSEEAKNCPYCAEVTAIQDDKKKIVTRSTYIDQANKLKTDNKATVYSIGPSAGKAGVDVLQKIASDGKYYNVGSDDLSQTFKDIAGVIVASSLELNKSSVVLDEISDSFMLPEGTNASDIKVYTEDYDGVADDVDKFTNRQPFTEAKIEIDGKKIKVSNFDYKANAVYSTKAENFGKRLIVEIPITENPDFLGGDDVPTNKDTAGIYHNDVLVKEFEEPKVDVDLNIITPVFNSKDIYLSQTAPLPEIINLGCFTKVDEEGEKHNYKVNGINNAYVDIVYTIKEKNGNSQQMTYTIPAKTAYEGSTDHSWTIPEGMTTHPILKEDTEYEVTCTVTSINDRSNRKDDDVDGVVRVFKPEITFNDTVIDLGETADYAENGGTVVWKHEEEVAEEDKMGAAPILEYEYSPEAGEFIEETPVTVEVTAKSNNTTILKDQDITADTTFYRKACDFRSCSHSEYGIVTVDEPNFVVHLDTFDLVIKKDGANKDLDDNQTFIFQITGPDGFLMDIVIEGNGEAKVVSLPIGTTDYKVTELEDWSWRYEVEGNKEVAVNLENHVNGTVTVTFNNKREEPSWMDGNSWCQNIFEANSVTQSGNIYQEGDN